MTLAEKIASMKSRLVALPTPKLRIAIPEPKDRKPRFYPTSRQILPGRGIDLDMSDIFEIKDAVPNKGWAYGFADNPHCTLRPFAK